MARGGSAKVSGKQLEIRRFTGGIGYEPQTGPYPTMMPGERLLPDAELFAKSENGAGSDGYLPIGLASDNSASEAHSEYLADALGVSSNLPRPDGSTPLLGRFDLRIEGRLARFDATDNDGNFAIVHGGIDYLVNRNLLIGLGVQFDWSNMKTVSGGNSSGRGYAVGPYVSVKLSERAFLDASASWGRARNKTSPFGTNEDGFDSTRFNASGSLIGEFGSDAFMMRPEIRISYFREDARPIPTASALQFLKCRWKPERLNSDRHFLQKLILISKLRLLPVSLSREFGRLPK